MASNRHCAFIQPQEPEIGRIADLVLKSMAASGPEITNGALLAGALDYFWQAFRKIEIKGTMTTGESIKTGRGNCFSLSCLVASALRRLGTTEHAVAVFVGCPKTHPDLVHAYVLTVGTEPGHITVVEPELMKAMDFSLEEFWAKHRIYFIFNDRMETTIVDEQREWLMRLAGSADTVRSQADALDGKTAPARNNHSPTKPSVAWIAYGAVNQLCQDILRQLAKSNENDSSREALKTLEAQYRSKIAVVSAAVTAQLTQIAIRAAQNYFRVVSSEMDDLRRLTACFRHGGKQLQWSDLAHIIIAGLLIDLGVREQLLLTGTINEQPDDFWIWGFEGGTGAANAFGIHLLEAEGKAGTFYELWHREANKPQSLKLDLPTIRLLRSISQAQSVNASDLNSDDQRRALRLAFYRLSTKQNGKYSVNIPFLDGAGAQGVRQEISRVSQLLISQAVMPALHEADTIYASEFSASPADIFRHGFARLLMEHAMDRLIEGKAVPAFPLQPGYDWGCWLSWMNHEWRF